MSVPNFVSSSDDARWAAVLAHDRRADGAFVYAVRTTGIYCRPSCPARRPKRPNVAFFGAPAEAEEAGFRACRRCRPRAEAASQAEAAVLAARAYLDARPGEAVPLADLAAAVGLSPSHLQRTFTRVVGLSPRAYADARRLAAFRGAARAADSVLAAGEAAGFGSQRALYAHADAALGMTPGVYRRGGAGTHVRYTLLDVALGTLLVAATERGVCAVALGDTPEALEADLRAEFEAATVERDDAALEDWAAPVVRYLDGDPAHPAVPVDLRGTDFQRRVWHALGAIPYGETRTYAQLAAALGQPTAARAVASACARNRVALIVPCHRIVRHDGAPGGYRWGPARKERLLAMEAAHGDDA